jgi:hypothetical protein
MKLELTTDFRDFVALLNDLDVKYVLVGGYAVAWHGHPRFTKDIDFFVERSHANAERLLQVLDRFGFSSLGVTMEDLLEENTCLYFGHPPNRIDLINFADGLTFDEAWASREQGQVDQLRFFVANREVLIKNKRAAGRAQDLADVQKLESRE